MCSPGATADTDTEKWNGEVESCSKEDKQHGIYKDKMNLNGDDMKRKLQSVRINRKIQLQS